uniref:MATH domain-containing protein n=1 Tax=Panagrolaimus sp. PS1159 TaxID=55785 RepID=A0AC35G934_9BILA
MSSSSLSSLTSSTTAATTPTIPKTIEKISFRYIWPVRVVQRQLNHNEAIILHISPKFATVFDHVAFQWTIKMHGSASLDSDESADFQDPDYIAISLYYVDGPISAVDVYAHVDISTSPSKDSSPPGSATPLLPTLPSKSRSIHSTRGRETEILHSNRQSLT